MGKFTSLSFLHLPLPKKEVVTFHTKCWLVGWRKTEAFFFSTRLKGFWKVLGSSYPRDRYSIVYLHADRITFSGCIINVFISKKIAAIVVTPLIFYLSVCNLLYLYVSYFLCIIFKVLQWNFNFVNNFTFYWKMSI